MEEHPARAHAAVFEGNFVPENDFEWRAVAGGEDELVPREASAWEEGGGTWEITPPAATTEYTSEELAAMGIVGVVRTMPRRHKHVKTRDGN